MSQPVVADAPPAEAERSGRRLLLPAGLVGLGGLLGVVGGWAWHAWWSPARPGRVFETEDGVVWLPFPWDPGQAQVFAGTAQYAVVGLVGGVLLGVVAAVTGRRRALAALAGLLLATAVAAAVTFVVGTALGPPDPQGLAAEKGVGAELPSSMQVDGWTPYLCWSLGGLVAWLAATLLVNSAENVRRREAGGGWLRPGGSEPSPPA
ncbi:hypothetical protein [Nocardioides sp. TF02-7]|uniref:hypothetical protein n=1 Tax=Nocardioides sp. TF02-7 TaxID=2917724 RepID=UPI001F06986C|nr:hypothetical protein [Nocardioides sp. TF02-7]UMG92116.1 hypothetical protein MF408_19535 [Nocardioides sp. TF02-7]